MFVLSCMRTQGGRGLAVLYGVLLLLCATLVQAAPPSALEQERIAVVFPAATSVSDPQGQYGVRAIHQGEELLGYSFETISVLTTPAYCQWPFTLPPFWPIKLTHPCTFTPSFFASVDSSHLPA